MILSNNQILNLINNNGLIQNFSQNSIKNCSYKLRIGEIIKPESGDICQLKSGEGYLIKPSEVVIIKTLERINMPSNIAASYSALNSFSQKGLLLINASMVEPNYSGYLSCFLLNFSSLPIRIYKNKEIAKITFFELSSVPSNLITENISEQDYIEGLQKSAVGYHSFFLNLSGFKDSIKNEVVGESKKIIIGGGILIAFLIAFATLEPISSKWLLDKTGISSGAEKYKNELVLKEIKSIEERINEKENSKKLLIDLQKDIDSLKIVIDEIRSKK